MFHGSSSERVSHSHSRFLVSFPFAWTLIQSSSDSSGRLSEVLFLSFFSESMGRASSIAEVDSDGVDERDEGPGEGSIGGAKRGRGVTDIPGWVTSPLSHRSQAEKVVRDKVQSI